MRTLRLAALAGCLMGTACSGDDNKGSGNNAGTGGSGNAGGMGGSGNAAGTSGTGATTGSTYEFESQFALGESSVSYSGQIARHVLIDDLSTFIGTLTDRIDGATLAAADVPLALNFYFNFDSDASGDEPLSLTTTPASKQTTYAEISTGKNIVGKLAGNDSVTDWRDWQSEFVGWGAQTPQELVELCFTMLRDNATDRENGELHKDPFGNDLPVHVTKDGLDLQQLVQKFLLGAVAFAQGTDDYLDSDIDGTGLLSDHTGAKAGEVFTALEHSWDEAFGYFGAARDYANYTDEELSKKGGRDDYQGYHDSDGDNSIDLKSEFNFGASLNAAKRDRGSADSAKTDFTAEAYDGFRAGRALLADSIGPLSDEQRAELEGHRDAAVKAWEKAIAATVVHYLNDTLVATNTFGDAEFSFTDYAKHWSELKGFALSFQFNPRSPVSKEDFVALHGYVGEAPVSPLADATEVDAYRDALRSARALLGAAYEFDAANLGDENGENGW